MNPYSGLGDFGPQTIISVTSVGIAKRRLQMNDMNDPNPRVFFGVWEVFLNGSNLLSVRLTFPHVF